MLYNKSYPYELPEDAMEKEDPSLQKVTGLINGVYPAFAMLAGLQLDVFTPLSQRPFTPQQLATQLQVDELRRLQ